MAPRTAAQVSDWQTVQPEDWTTVDAGQTQQAEPSRGPAPLARTPGNYASEAASGIGRGLSGLAQGTYQTLRHPIQTATGLADQLAAAQRATQAEDKELQNAYPAGSGIRNALMRNAATADVFLQNAPIIGGAVQHAEQGGTRPLSPESVGAAAELGTQVAAPELAGRALGAVPRLTRATSETLSGTRGVTKGMVEETTAANAEAASKAADANHKAAMKHLEDTQNALHETRGRELTHAQLVQQAKDVAAAQRRASESKLVADRAEANAKRIAAQEKHQKATAAQKRIEPTQKKLSNAWSGLRASVETARENANRIGNEKYSTVNSSLNNLPANMEGITNAYGEALHSFGEAGNVPPILKRMEGTLNEPLTYKDLQLIYSDLGKELSKGTLPGSTYHAYDVLQEAVGDDMQRIADSEGLGGQLSDARNYWRRMKQTFGKPLARTDAATGVLRGSASGIAAEDVLQNQIRLLGSFDPSIPGQFAHVQNIERGVEAMPNPVSERELTRQRMEASPNVPANRPAGPAPKAVSPVERIAPPNRPVEHVATPRTISAEDVRIAKQNALAKRIGGGNAANTVVAIDAIRNVMRGNPAGLAIDVGSRAAFGAGRAMMQSLIEKPTVLNFLTQATERDIAQIPPDLRGSFPNIIRQAQSQGIKVSPALLGIAGNAGLPAPRMNPSDAWSQGLNPQ